MKDFLKDQDLDVLDVMSAPTEQPKTAEAPILDLPDHKDDPFASKLNFLEDIELQSVDDPAKEMPASSNVDDEITTLDDVENPEMDEQTTDQSSSALIDMIDLVQKVVFGMIGTRKITKKIPEDLLEEMMAIDLKDLRGETLTAEEKKKFQRYKDFNTRVERFVDGIAFTNEERDELREATKVFVKKQGIKIPPSVWFFTQVAHKLSSRVVDVFQI